MLSHLNGILRSDGKFYQILISISIDELEQIICRSVENALLLPPASPSNASAKFLSRKEAAIFLKISLPTLHKRTVDGQLQSYRIGSSIRYLENSAFISM